MPPLAVPVVGTGDAPTAKEAEKLAAIDACLQLSTRGLFNKVGVGIPSGGPVPGTNDGRRVVLQNGAIVGLEEARAFMDYYCTRFSFGRPELSYTTLPPARRGGASHWRATLRVGGAQIGVGEARAKKDAMNRAYLDTASYLEGCDPSLWSAWEDKKRNKLVEKGDVQAHVVFEAPGEVEEELRDAVYESGKSELYKRAREMRGLLPDSDDDRAHVDRTAQMDLDDDGGGGGGSAQQRAADRRRAFLDKKSATLLKRLQDYQASSDPSLVKLRTQRASLPVTSHASSVLAKISTSSSGVVVVLAATGSGKTTQLPQLLLDDEILAGRGAECNIVCTQPRRIAAISVAERVAKERGEAVGESVGYQVRFEAKPPKKDGSILFCTTGLFLRRMQADLEQAERESFLDGVTHVCVDEVHERDVDTDLLLFVLRRLLWERRKQGKKEIKVVLMSATIDPRLFTEYFADPDTRSLAPVIEVPGRSFPVEKRWLDDTINELEDLRLPQNRGGWVLNDKSVVQYLQRELVPSIPFDPRTGRPVGEIDDLDMPYPLLALIIAHVLKRSDDGHVLVFLPGWDEIQAVRNILMDRHRYPLFDLDFANSRGDLEIHVLHSSIPLAEQQAVFEPPRERVRRVVLSTNIAETSVTIPDVVFVVDSAKCKEKRYDPERRLSQLVSAWTGTSNVLQRAGRAGRHRPGEYYGIVSKARFASMDIHQTVEMLRTDLASTAMHVTGLQLPGLSVFDVLSSTIQPPEPQRVTAALETLLHVGAIDRDEKLTSLGRVLLQLPVEAAIGKLCLLGSFFRCLDQTLTLAAILTNRDPFLSPPAMKAEADRIKNTWAPTDFRGDPFAILKAYNAWWELQSRADYNAANAFCRDNFLSKPTLLLIQKIKDHLLSSLDRAGALQISAGGAAAPPAAPVGRGRFARNAGPVIPSELNVNGDSLPLLAALIATAVAPNFAIRVSEKSLRTSQDRACAIHPSSVNSRKNEKASDAPVTSSKQLYAYAEKSKTGAMSGKGEGQTFLRGTTRLDPLGYMLFGAYSLEVTTEGLECDGWLPIVAPRPDMVSALDDVERLKDILDLSLLRVFEGLGVAITRGRGRGALTGAGNNKGASAGKGRGRQFDRDDEDENEGDEDAVDAEHDPTLSAQEIKDLDTLTGNVSNLLDSYHHALGPATTANSRVASRANSRPQTPQPGGGGGGGGGSGFFGASHPPSNLQFSSTSGGWKSRGGLLGGGGGSSAGSSRSGTPYNSRPPSAGAASGSAGAGGGGGGFGSGGGGAASSGASWRR
ncbi:P-loop containing nucleoside triphosphate hydrolase protein [Rhodotorula sp. JG-1b]|nr:P-loop containing nucleoside triphosphate hydrolase protein [Rhodotorula sp. JG-1b]